jgi:hypothetical protein
MDPPKISQSEKSYDPASSMISTARERRCLPSFSRLAGSDVWKVTKGTLPVQRRPLFLIRHGPDRQITNYRRP